MALRTINISGQAYFVTSKEYTAKKTRLLKITEKLWPPGLSSPIIYQGRVWGPALLGKECWALGPVLLKKNFKNIPAESLKYI